jgi:glutamyl-tRNA reductase
MNLLVVGLSHHTAPADLLERVAVPRGETPALLGALMHRSHVNEAVVVSTCNRLDIVAGVTGFHAGLADVAAVLGARTGIDSDTLARHLYVHHDEQAVRHVYRVAAGLDSMIAGEPQILGQVRDAYAVAVDHDAVGRALHELMQRALRVGKRVHSETGIDLVGRDMVTAALDHGLALAGLATDGARALVVGTGAMGGLALATLRRAGATDLMVAGRDQPRATRLAAAHDATAVPMAARHAVLRDVDIVVSATASTSRILSATDLPAGRTGPLLILDLAVPRDVDPAVADVPGVTLVDIGSLRAARTGTADTDLAAAETIVAEEVTAFVAWLRGFDVAPTVAALRARADDLVGVELAALQRRQPELSEAQRADVARTVHRLVQRLLHEPTVRVRELAAGPGGDRYPALVRELFDLDPGQMT